MAKKAKVVFLKYISDCFEKRYNELVEEGDGFEEDRDEYTAEHVFWVPQDARWNVIASKALSPEIGQVIDHALKRLANRTGCSLLAVMLVSLTRKRMQSPSRRRWLV